MAMAIRPESNPRPSLEVHRPQQECHCSIIFLASRLRPLRPSLAIVRPARPLGLRLCCRPRFSCKQPHGRSCAWHYPSWRHTAALCVAVGPTQGGLGSSTRSRHPAAKEPHRGNDNRRDWRSVMLYRAAIGTMVFTAAALCMPTATQAFDDAIYPALMGQWTRAILPGAVGQPPFDPAKPPGRGQTAPLTPETQPTFETILADRVASGLGVVVSTTSLAPAMPIILQTYEPMQITALQ